MRFEHDRFAEVDPTDGDVWNTWQVGLATRPGKGRRVTKSFVHFAPIRQEWRRDLTKKWVADTMPTVENAQRTIRAVSVASTGLASRPGGGHDRTLLGGADMAAAFAALRDGRLVGGELASVRLRQRFIRLFFALIDFGRRTDLLADVPGAFAQLREHVLPDTEVTEDHLGRAIPESVIRHLDQHLDLLGCRTSDWLAVEPAAFERHVPDHLFGDA